MPKLEPPKGWLLFWSVARVFNRLDGHTISALADAALLSGLDEPELIEIVICDDLRSEEGLELLEPVLQRLDTPLISHREACEAIARNHLRERIALGESRALAAFTLPVCCTWGADGMHNEYSRLKWIGEEIHELEIGYLSCLSRKEKQRIIDQIDDFERTINELCVGYRKYTDAEIGFMSLVAQDCLNEVGMMDYWFDPVRPPEAYRHGLDL